jgi:protein-tyrosine phosphatase
MRVDVCPNERQACVPALCDVQSGDFGFWHSQLPPNLVAARADQRNIASRARESGNVWLKVSYEKILSECALKTDPKLCHREIKTGVWIMISQRWAIPSALINDKYAGKRALIAHLRSLAILKFGGLWRYQRVNWPKVQRLVFICKGNICRSPYAHARVAAAGFPSASCGLSAGSGLPANPKAVLIAAERNISLVDHRTTAFSAFIPNRGDLLICMEPWQVAVVESTLTDQNIQVTLLGLWAQPRRPILPDPYGLGDGYWRTCLNIIDNAVDRILQLVNGNAPRFKQ